MLLLPYSKNPSRILRGAMKTLEEIQKERPYLKEQLDLYRKLQGLRSLSFSTEGYIPMEKGFYPPDTLVYVITEVSKILGIEIERLNWVKDMITSGNIDFRRLPIGDIQLKHNEYSQEELDVILYFISKPFFLHEKQKLSLDGIYWDEGKCPVCNSVPSVSIIGREEKRRFYCSYCETVGYWKRIGCPSCLTEVPEDITIVMLDAEEGIRADLCERCKNYYKSFNSSMLNEYTEEMLDLISLPLDIIVQQKGYHRSSPNPLGMKRLL
jgi:FdhE protein